MNQRQFASVLFAVIGVFIIATRLPELWIHAVVLARSNTVVESAVGGASRYTPAIGLSASVVAILAGGILILLRHRLAGRLFAAASDVLDVRGAQEVALSVLGCYFAVLGISRIGWLGWADWPAVLQLALGVALFFGARGLSGLWWLSRSAGQSRRAVNGYKSSGP